MTLRLLINIVILSSISPLHAMISYNHSETDDGKHVFASGEIHSIDQIVGPGASEMLLSPLVRVLGDIKPPRRLPVILEMNPTFLKTGKASVVSPLCQEMVALYRTLLQREHNPLFLTLVDGREIESEFYHGLSSQVSEILRKHIPYEQITIFSTKPTSYKEPKKDTVATIIAALTIATQPHEEIPKTQTYLEAIEAQQRKLIEFAEHWKNKEKAAPIFAKAVATHKAALELLREKLKGASSEEHLWKSLIRPFLQQKTTFGLLTCYDELESLNRQTNYLFHDMCLLHKLLVLFAAGHTAVALLVGNTHARELATVFNDVESGLAWKQVAHKTCCEKQGLAVSYSIDRNFGEKIADAAQAFIQSSSIPDTPQPSFEEQCYQCFITSSAPLAQCSGCHTARYCSKECQSKDWRLHKQWCSSKK